MSTLTDSPSVEEPPLQANSGCVPFTGRQAERERIKGQLRTQSCHLVHISGFPMVGKAALAQQVMFELSNEWAEDKIIAKHVPCKRISDWTDFLVKFTKACHLTEKIPQNEAQIHSWLLQITEEEPVKRHLIVLTKCDELIYQQHSCHKFLSFLEDIITDIPNFSFILTSRRILDFSPNIRVWKEPLMVMSLSDSVNLLQRVAVDVDLCMCGEEIARLCHCYPFGILKVGQILVSHNGFQPSDLCEILRNENDAVELLSPRFSRSENRYNDIIQGVFGCLPSDIKHTVSRLCGFKRSFTIDAATQVTGHHSNSRTKLKLLPLLEESMLQFDNTTQRYSLPPFIQPIIGMDPEVRSIMGSTELRYVKFFGDLLLQLQGSLYLENIDRIYGYLHEDYENVAGLLRRAIHDPVEDGNLFKAYMEVVRGTEDLIVICFPHEAEKFFAGLSTMAAMFGSEEDRAVLKSHQACAMTGMLVGGNLPEAVRLYEEALAVLEGAHDQYQLLLLVQRMVRTYNRMGRNTEVKRFIKLARSLSSRSCGEVKTKMERLKLGVVADEMRLEIFHENYDKVAAVIGYWIEEAYNLAPHHPAIGKLINCIGLLNDRSNRDKAEALRHYRLSIQEKAKYQRQCPEMMVDSMNNAAMLVCKELGDKDKALAMLQETLDICLSRYGWEQYDTALTLWNIGQTYIRKLDFVTACEKIKQARDIFSKSTPEHWANVEVRWTLGHCYMATEKFHEAKTMFFEIKAYKELYARHMPQADLVSSAIEHLLYLDDTQNWLSLYHELTEELQRMQRENLRARNEEKRVQNSKKEEDYHVLARQFCSEHEKSRLIRPANPVLATCFICQRYGIPYYSPAQHVS